MLQREDNLCRTVYNSCAYTALLNVSEGSGDDASIFTGGGDDVTGLMSLAHKLLCRFTSDSSRNNTMAPADPHKTLDDFISVRWHSQT